jgi:16S rRNA (guanine966-N2)-methyltransferase
VRIIAGKFKGRDLTSPADFRVRPTAEHVRGALLDLLAEDLPGASVLDLFAGTGALGLEAISRGARRCDFVETRPTSLAALKSNIIKLRLKERTRVFKKDALPFAGQLNADAYDLVFVDPPYESRMLDRVIDSWMARHFTPVLAVEHARTHILPRGALTRTFEDTSVTIYRAPRAEAATAPATAAPTE